LEKAVILSENGKITENTLGMNQKPNDPGRGESVSLEEMEKKLIEKSIGRHGGNLSQVARELGITRATLYRKMEKFEL
jgi:transcriptional regulator of acetoin/glycerol metabolism